MFGNASYKYLEERIAKLERELSYMRSQLQLPTREEFLKKIDEESAAAREELNRNFPDKPENKK